jgi:hypothetical protein
MFETLISQYIWAPWLQKSLKDDIDLKLKQCQERDIIEIERRSIENIESLHKSGQQTDDKTINYLMMYKERIYVHQMNEILDFFKDHGEGEDYYMKIEEGEIDPKKSTSDEKHFSLEKTTEGSKSSK